MEALFAGLLGICLGLLGLLLVRPRETMGMALIPALAGATALVWWIIATWAAKWWGLSWLRYDQFWIWALAAVLALAVTVPLALTLPRVRQAADTDLFERLSHRAG